MSGARDNLRILFRNSPWDAYIAMQEYLMNYTGDRLWDIEEFEDAISEHPWHYIHTYRSLLDKIDESKHFFVLD